MEFRKGQKELIENYQGGFCAIPAIPGGGKTFSVSAWAAQMIAAKRQKPGKLLIVTYMNSAANSIRRRIGAMLEEMGVNNSRDYTVSTIHGLCLQIVKEKPDLIKAHQEFSVIDDAGRASLIDLAVEEWQKKNAGRLEYFLEDTAGKESVYIKWRERFRTVVSGAIGSFKIKGLDPMMALDLCKRTGNNGLMQCCAGVYEAYDRRLKMKGMVDFDDMLTNALRLLKQDRELLSQYQKKYSFVCEDEAQDSNAIQTEILTLISHGNFLRVGDSNQAICGTFTSSDFKLFRDFCSLPATSVYSITQSGRSTRQIIELANHFVNFVREKHPLEECRKSLLPQYIEPVENGPGTNPVIEGYGISADIFESWEDEAAAAVNRAGKIMAQYPDQSVAILVPAAYKMVPLLKILEDRGLPFEQLENTSYQRSRPIRELGSLIDYLLQPWDKNRLDRMITQCLLTEKEAGNKELKEIIASQQPEDLIYPLTPAPDNDSGRLLVEKIKQLLELPLHEPERLVLEAASILDFDEEERAMAQRVCEEIRYQRKNNSRWELSDIAAELLKQKNVFTYFAGVLHEQKGYQPQPGVITLCTWHKAKGLEWDSVFLTGLNYSDFPATLQDKFVGEYWYLKPGYRNPEAVFKAELDKAFEGTQAVDIVNKARLENISERVRLLYVGITRAKKYLYLSGFHANPGKKNEVPPSAYLLHMKQYIEQKKKEYGGG